MKTINSFSIGLRKVSYHHFQLYIVFFLTDCKDQYRFCVDLKSKWCSNSFVKVNCKKSCNLCPTTTCEDLATKRNCNYWRGLRYCTTGHWIQYMRTNCKKTCGHC